MKKSISPLRYPGGKTKLYDKVSNIIISNKLQNCTYVEPFAGGAGLALSLLMDGIVSNIFINDYDYHVYAFWYSILNFCDEFISLIKNTEITINQWHIQKEIYNNYNDFSILEVGFSFFFLNRTNHSGILKAGPIGGYKQTGNYLINCRFNKENLIKLIKSIHQYRKHIKIYNLDAKYFITNNINRIKHNCFVNFDPPYFERGPELYTNFYKENNHIELHNAILKCNKPWIVTYDSCEFIKNLYKDFISEDIILSYSAGNIKYGKEVLIYGPNVLSYQSNINMTAISI